MRGSVLGIKFRYTQRRDGSIRYRRPVPPELRAIIDKGELTRVLGASKKEAISNWGVAHREVEGLFADARRALVGETGATDGFGDSEFAEYRGLERRLREAGFDPSVGITVSAEDMPEDHPERILLADALVDSYPVDPATGEANVPEQEVAFIRALNNGMPPRPAPTLADAAKLYLAEKVKGTDRKATASRQRVDRIMSKALDVLGGDRRIDLIRRTDALKIRDRLLSDYEKPATAKRYMVPLMRW